MIKEALLKYRGIVCKEFGDVSVMTPKEFGLKAIAPSEVLVKTMATAINRADLLQRQGKYPPPAGAPEILGLEASGYIANPDGSCDRSQPVMALLSGGGYGEYFYAHKDHVMPVPKGISIIQAAAIPEAWLTAFLGIRILADIQKNDNVFLYAGSSGVATAGIQLCKMFGAKVFVSCSSEEKLKFCKDLGADVGFNYTQDSEEKILESIQKETDSKGINILMDCVMAKNYSLSSKCLAMDGKWVLYGSLSGASVEKVDMSVWLRKRIQLIGTTLRNRSDSFKTNLIEKFKAEVLPHFADGRLKPVVDTVLEGDWETESIAKAFRESHSMMERNANKGKIIVSFKDQSL